MFQTIIRVTFLDIILGICIFFSNLSIPSCTLKFTYDLVWRSKTILKITLLSRFMFPLECHIVWINLQFLKYIEHDMSWYIIFFRSDVLLKEVSSRYILKSTLTPRLARKELQKGSNTGLQKSHSCSSLNNANLDGNTNKKFNNYLTVHVSKSW